MKYRRAWLTVLLVLALLSSDALHVLTEAKRGGGGGGFGRGGSASRGSGGGLFGGSKSSGTRTGTGGGYKNTGSSGGIFGSSSNHRTGYNQGGYGKFSNSQYSKGSGIGSMARSSTFKNMVVGAAAGYLTYQAGKAIIRSTMSPMMWGGRPYYWGQNYYQGRQGESMCRMPLEGDSQFGNVYFQDNTRPKEIVWSCRYNEYCCGYECCPSGNGGYGYRGGIGLGSIIVLLLLCGCGAFVIHQVCKARRSTNGASFFSSNNKYSPGQATYTAANEPPPQYSANGNGSGGAANFNYNNTYPPPPQPPGFVYS